MNDLTYFFGGALAVACVLTRENADTRWVLDNEAQVLMGRMGEAIVGAWRPAPQETVALILCGANCDPASLAGAPA